MNDSPRRKPAADDSSIKETFQSIIVAFILAFVFRGFVVEAFVIPTGSMAPTLLGQHVAVTCPQCGYRFSDGPRDYLPNRIDPVPIQGRSMGPLEMHCPMCNYPIIENAAPLDAGDRILVLKYVYAFSEPRRWDVVVFRPPGTPQINYIKRLVGLPHEWLRIIRGNIFTSKDQGQTWRIERKPVQAQQAVWQPVYHSERQPLDDGSSAIRQEVWTSPWRAQSPELWTTKNRGRTLAFKPDAAGRPGVLEFDFAHHPWSAKDYVAYNELTMQSLREPPVFIEDLRAGVTVLPRDAAGGVELMIGGELLDYQAVVAPDGSVQLRIADGGAQRASRSWTTVAQATGRPLQVDQPHRVELWCVDQSAQLWIDGVNVLRYDIPVADQPDEQSPFVLSVKTLLEHNAIRESPRVAISLTGAAIDVSDIDLDRDLYYTNTDESGSLATFNNIAKLADNEFFCLGDNSPASADGRRWKSVDPWVTYLTRNDHTHLGPDGADLPGVGNGIVPRRLMIGRAFFVYWPAPHRLSPFSWLPVPNFGDMRFIH